MTTECARCRKVSAVAVAVLLVSALAGCGGNPANSASGIPAPSPVEGSGPFDNLPYWLDLPTDWNVMGTDGYDSSIDGTPDVSDWLTQLHLTGPNAFRAYEPVRDAAGLRVAINATTGPAAIPQALQDVGALAALPGVSGQPIGDIVPGGDPGTKDFRSRWTETLDWGSGSPTARACVGYVVEGEFNPVVVVFSYPADANRLADVEALMASFKVTGSPSAATGSALESPTAGGTGVPTPPPGAKGSPLEPTPVPHAAPKLEALLPDDVDGVVLMKESHSGVDIVLAGMDPIFDRLGKQPSDLIVAIGTPDTSTVEFIVQADRLDGVPGADLLTALIDVSRQLSPDTQVSEASLGGHDVTHVQNGGWLPWWIRSQDAWFYAAGDVVIAVAAVDADRASAVFEALP